MSHNIMQKKREDEEEELNRDEQYLVSCNIARSVTE